MAAQDVGKIVREIIDAWNARDLDRCASHAHADAKMRTIPFGQTLSYREYIENWARAFPDGKIELTRVIAQGDDAMAEFTGRGTHTGTLKGPMGDLPGTQRQVEVQCVETYRFRGGKLAEGQVYFDAYSFFTQLGIGAPAQGRAAAATPPARP